MNRTEFVEAGRPVKTESLEAPIRDLYRALEALIGTENCVISGCEVTLITGGFNISSGLVYIGGKLATVYEHNITSSDPCLYLSTQETNVTGSEVVPNAVGQPNYYATKELIAEASQDTDTAAAYNAGRIRLYGYDILDTVYVRKMSDRYSNLTSNEISLLFGAYINAASQYKRIKRFTVKHQLSGTNVTTITTPISNEGLWAGEVIGVNLVSFKASGGTIFVSANDSNSYPYAVGLSFPASPTDRVLTMYKIGGGTFTFDGEVIVEYLIEDTMTPF